MRLIKLHNNQRDKMGTLPLIAKKELDVAAQRQAEWMARIRRQTHYGPWFSSISTRVKQAGITTFRRVGENVANGYTTPEAVFEQWLKSSRHLQNINNAYFTHIGIGRKGNYWCVVFAEIPSNL